MGELQLPKDHSAPRHRLPLWCGPVSSLQPRPLASPLLSLRVCVSDPEAVRGGGTVGGRRRRRLHQQHQPCRALGFASSPPGAHHKAGPTPLPRPAAPPRSAPRPTSLCRAWPAGEEDETPRCLLALSPQAHFTPSLRVPETCWDSDHQQLSGECPRRAAGGIAVGSVKGAGQAGTQLPRRLLWATGGLFRPACAPPRRRRPGAEFAAPASRALAGGSAFVRSQPGAPSPSVWERGDRPPSPSPAPRVGRLLQMGSSAEAGRKREMKETKGAVGFSFVCANLVTSFSFLT